jgi:hypothetical protein
MLLAVKLLLTVLVGSLLSIVVLFIPPDAVPIVIPQALIGPFCVATVFITTIVFATFLHLRECNGWGRSVLMGMVFGLAGSTIIMAVGYVFISWVSKLP